MKQIHLYPSFVIETTLTRVRLTPFRINRVKADVISRMEWTLEFRRNMLLVPELCFEEKIILLREKNKEIHQRHEEANK
ncbi:hypothetical protein E9993_22925 [Labilibacter sediminis]|nr:hypothetical protein E9993_22925 [Labilibacter sediminis]